MQPVFDALSDALRLIAVDPFLFGVVAGFCGWAAGGFLTVVIDRLPRIIEAEAEGHETALCLTWPPSSCICGQRRLDWLEILPLIGWLLVRGRCKTCGISVSRMEPVIELAALVMAIGIAMTLGPGLHTAAVILAGWLLLGLAAIDLKNSYLPDQLSLPLLFIGLLAAMANGGIGAAAAAAGAAAGYFALAGMNALYSALRGQRGIFPGDYLLAAGIGAWVGPLGIMWVIGGGALLTLVLAPVIRALNRGARPDWQPELAVPYGPGLALAVVIAMLMVDVIPTLPV